MGIYNWNEHFIRIADLEIAQSSEDKSSKVGCVLVKNREIISTGYNGFPRGCNDSIPERHERPEKYNWTLHAEINAVINAARQHKCTLDTDAYLNWYPCDHCSGVLVNAGIKRLYCDEEPNWDDIKWGNGFHRARTILEEGGIEVFYLNYKSHRNVMDLK